jgi:hypothetical protein
LSATKLIMEQVMLGAERFFASPPYRMFQRLFCQRRFAGEIALLNGVNSDPEIQAIYKAWLTRHKGSDNDSRSKSANMKAAIVDAFRDEQRENVNSQRQRPSAGHRARRPILVPLA